MPIYNSQFGSGLMGISPGLNSLAKGFGSRWTPESRDYRSAEWDQAQKYYDPTTGRLLPSTPQAIRKQFQEYESRGELWLNKDGQIQIMAPEKAQSLGGLKPLKLGTPIMDVMTEVDPAVAMKNKLNAYDGYAQTTQFPQMSTPQKLNAFDQYAQGTRYPQSALGPRLPQQQINPFVQQLPFLSPPNTKVPPLGQPMPPGMPYALQFASQFPFQDFSGRPPVQAFKNGGEVESHNPGQPVPIIAHEGEGILTKEALEAIGGEQMLNAINHVAMSEGPQKARSTITQLIELERNGSFQNAPQFKEGGVARAREDEEKTRIAREERRREVIQQGYSARGLSTPRTENAPASASAIIQASIENALADIKAKESAQAQMNAAAARDRAHTAQANNNTINFERSKQKTVPSISTVNNGTHRVFAVDPREAMLKVLGVEQGPSVVGADRDLGTAIAEQNLQRGYAPLNGPNGVPIGTRYPTKPQNGIQFNLGTYGDTGIRTIRDLEKPPQQTRILDGSRDKAPEQAPEQAPTPTPHPPKGESSNETSDPIVIDVEKKIAKQSPVKTPFAQKNYGVTMGGIPVVDWKAINSYDNAGDAYQELWSLANRNGGSAKQIQDRFAGLTAHYASMRGIDDDINIRRWTDILQGQTQKVKAHEIKKLESLAPYLGSMASLANDQAFANVENTEAQTVLALANANRLKASIGLEGIKTMDPKDLISMYSDIENIRNQQVDNLDNYIRSLTQAMDKVGGNVKNDMKTNIARATLLRDFISGQVPLESDVNEVAKMYGARDKTFGDGLKASAGGLTPEDVKAVREQAMLFQKKIKGLENLVPQGNPLTQEASNFANSGLNMQAALSQMGGNTNTLIAAMESLRELLSQ